MDSLGRIPGIIGPPRVEQRAAGGNKQRADAFRQALQQEVADGTQPEPEGADEQPVRTRLQARPPASRRDDGTVARHVDVIA
ncbi:MAG TPA: hypothetical protein VFZ65_17975 [Planctomycetota bacterium]|nr:hypothetical protein [Planctomycetota bacterium]